MKATTLLLPLALALPVVSSCGDPVRPDPLHAQSAELAQIKGMLTTVIARLDALEASATLHDTEVKDELTSIGTAISTLSVEGGVGATLGGYTALEGSLCVKNSWEADARFQSAVTLRGQADGMLGVDAYGNGAKGRVLAYGGQMVSVVPQGGAALELQLCGKLVGEAGLEAGIAATMDGTDPLVALLDGLMQSVGTNQLASAASSRSMNGTRTGQALDALSSFSLTNLPFGGGGASTLIDALPLPQDLRGMLDDPSSLFARAAPAAQYAVDQLCGSTLRVGEFTQMMSAGCDLRDDIPTPGEVIDIISGLEGLPATLGLFDSSLGTLQTSVGTLNTGMNTVCNTVGSITGATLVIPSRSVTILGTSYTTFPGYSAPLFPAIGAPNC